MTDESLVDQPVGHLVIGYYPGPKLAAEEIMYGPAPLHDALFFHFRYKMDIFGN